MTRVILGLFLLAFGIWGLFDNWYYFKDAFKGFLPLAMLALAALSFGVAFRNAKLFHNGVQDE